MADLQQSLPGHIREWKAVGKDRIYDRDTLFDYMNGGAEVYLAFDFRTVHVRKFHRPDGKEMTLDIYEMGSAPEAFGVFSCDREDEDAGLGQGSEYGFGLLRFWKGPYFVTIMTDAQGEEADVDVLELGRKVSDLLGPEGPVPQITAVLPETGLKKNRIAYFHGNIHLNNRFYISSDNILNLDSETECVIAEYDSAREKPVTLLVIRYEDSVKALAAYRSFVSSFMPESHPWTKARVTGEMVAVVFDAPDTDAAERMLSAVKHENRER